MKTPEDYVRRELAEAAKRLANARRVMMTSAEAPSKVAGPVSSLRCDTLVLFPVSSAERLATAWEDRAAKLRRTRTAAKWLRFCAEELRREIFWAKRGPEENTGGLPPEGRRAP